MAKLTVAQQKAKVAATIKVNGNREITPPKDKILRDDQLDSSPNWKDGGMGFESEVGYSTETTPIDPNAFTPKTYVDDAVAGATLGYVPLDIAGSNSMEAVLPMNGNDITNVGDINPEIGKGIISNSGPSIIEFISDALASTFRGYNLIRTYVLGGGTYTAPAQESYIAQVATQTTIKTRDNVGNTDASVEVTNTSVNIVTNGGDGLGIDTNEGNFGRIKSDNLTDEEEFQLPNKGGAGGTFAMVSDIADAIVGVYKDQGNFTPSGNYPTSANTLLGDAPKVGYTWVISGLGVGITALVGTKVVSDGDIVRVLVAPPAQVDANWQISENNLEYVPENVANKATGTGALTTSDTTYPSENKVKANIDLKVPVFPSPDGYTYTLEVVDQVATLVKSVIESQTPYSEEIKLLAGAVGDWVNGSYVGATSGAITGTKGGEFFDGQDATDSLFYWYKAKADNVWVRGLLG